jgi:integrase
LFEYLIANDKDFKHITQNDIDYITPDQNTSNIATQRREPKSYLVSEIISTIRNIKGITPFELRDKAMISLILLTGARIKAMMTARMDTVFYSSQYKVWIFEQDPKKGVKTKNRKYIYSCFVGKTQDLIDNIIVWKEYLISQGFTDTDPLFPQINSTFTKEGLYAVELNKISINSDSWVRESVFKKSFINNGLKYINPHNFRHTLARAMKKMPNGVELSIALAQNLGQKNEMPVLYSSYGGDYISRQVELLSNFPLE